MHVCVCEGKRLRRHVCMSVHERACTRGCAPSIAYVLSTGAGAHGDRRSGSHARMWLTRAAAHHGNKPKRQCSARAWLSPRALSMLQEVLLWETKRHA